MKYASVVIIAVCAGLLALAHAALVMGQAAPRAGQAAQEHAETLPAGAFARQRTDELDSEIASRVMRRAQVAEDQRATVELEIDLRIIHRWMWEQVSKGPSADVQSAAYARALAMGDAIAALEQHRRQQVGAVMTATQAQGVAHLHKLTFGLVDLKDVAALDRLSVEAGRAILNIASPGPIDPRTVPEMRPKAAGNDAAASAPANHDGPATVHDLSQEARAATVTVPLRAQLVAVATAAQEAEGDPERKAEFDRLHRLLADAMSMVRGLASNTAVAPDARMELEGELAAALALMADERLVAAGEARMKALQPYRQTLTRLGRLPLTATQRRQFAPAFQYAQNHPEEADKIFDALEEAVRLTPRYQALPAETTGDNAIRSAIAQLRSQFVRGEGDLPNQVSHLGEAGLFSMTAEDLAKSVREMRRAVEVLEVLYALPSQVQALQAYKPRPLGGLERRVQTLVTSAAVGNAIPSRAEAEATLRRVSELGKVALEVEARPLASLPRDGTVPYNGGVAEAFDKRCRDLIGQMAAAVASGQDVDPARLAEVRRAREVVDYVAEASTLSLDGTQWELLTRWADWTTAASDFDAMLTPLQREITGAVQAVAAGQSYDADGLRRMKARYEPILRFVSAKVARSEGLGELPTGLMGSAAKLMTPMAGGRHAAERYMGLATALWGFAEPEAGDPLVAALATRVAPEVGMRYREPSERRGRGR